MAFHPLLLNGCCINGCSEITDAGRAKLAAAKESAVPLDLLWNAHGQMPVIRWDRELLDWINARAEFLDALRAQGKPTAFWAAFDALPARDRKSDILTWNQGSIPSCCLTATSHAIQAATLIASLLGAPVRYDAVNLSQGFPDLDPPAEILAVPGIDTISIGPSDVSASTMRSRIRPEYVFPFQASVISSPGWKPVTVVFRIIFRPPSANTGRSVRSRSPRCSVAGSGSAGITHSPAGTR